MTLEEFDWGFQKIVSCFGEKSYPDQRRRLLFEKLRGLSRDHWNKVVDKVVLNCRYAPLLEDFQEAADATKMFFPSTSLERIDCATCEGHGIFMERGQDNGSYAWRCSCEAGKQFTKIPFFNSKALTSP